MGRGAQCQGPLLEEDLDHLAAIFEKEYRLIVSKTKGLWSNESWGKSPCKLYLRGCNANGRSASHYQGHPNLYDGSRQRLDHRLTSDMFEHSANLEPDPDYALICI